MNKKKKMNNLEYDPEDHSYSVDGKYIPGFSEIINPLVIRICERCQGVGCEYCKGKGRTNWYTEESSKRGKWIHERCYEILKGESDTDWWRWIESKFPDFVGHLRGWERFLKEYALFGKQFISEYPLHSPEIFTAGTPDLIFPTAGIGIEIKSGLKHESHIYQISVYNHLVEWNVKQGWLSEYELPRGPMRWFLVYLTEKGYDAREYPNKLNTYRIKFQSFQATYMAYLEFTGGK